LLGFLRKTSKNPSLEKFLDTTLLLFNKNISHGAKLIKIRKQQYLDLQ